MIRTRVQNVYKMFLRTLIRIMTKCFHWKNLSKVRNVIKHLLKCFSVLNEWKILCNFFVVDDEPFSSSLGLVLFCFAVFLQMDFDGDNFIWANGRWQFLKTVSEIANFGKNILLFGFSVLSILSVNHDFLLVPGYENAKWNNLQWSAIYTGRWLPP